MGWFKAVCLFVPRWSAGKCQLDEYTQYAHVPERPRKRGSRSWRGEEEQRSADHSWKGEVPETIRNPRQDIKNGVVVCGEDVGEVGAVQNVF